MILHSIIAPNFRIKRIYNFSIWHVFLKTKFASPHFEFFFRAVKCVLSEINDIETQLESRIEMGR